MQRLMPARASRIDDVGSSVPAGTRHPDGDGTTAYGRVAGDRIALAHVDPARVGTSAFLSRSRAAAAVKRTLDLIAATVLLVLTAPLSLLVAVWIKLHDGGPVLFRQTRVGRHSAPFVLRKFRSMRVDAEASTGPVWAQADDPRVTTVGRWMRPLGIDEIPQVWNVLRGEMSFVGPRPERPEFVRTLEAAIPCYRHRHAVRPGITGWAQVNFPYGATVEDARHKLEYDLYYLEHASVRMDLAIMLRTGRLALSGWRSR
jgi:lipopolysaccharide/colanic/teichoic acid biosynthesis glycosyltransferase